MAHYFQDELEKRVVKELHKRRIDQKFADEILKEWNIKQQRLWMLIQTNSDFIPRAKNIYRKPKGKRYKR